MDTKETKSFLSQMQPALSLLPRYETANNYLDFLKRKESELIKRIADFPVKVNQQQPNMRNLTETVTPEWVGKEK
jgi:vacuolar-type H+-ATPase subunit D/Vma8